jgi:hypothetical protein
MQNSGIKKRRKNELAARSISGKTPDTIKIRGSDG